MYIVADISSDGYSGQVPICYIDVLILFMGLLPVVIYVAYKDDNWFYINFIIHIIPTIVLS